MKIKLAANGKQGWFSWLSEEVSMIVINNYIVMVVDFSHDIARGQYIAQSYQLINH